MKDNMLDRSHKPTDGTLEAAILALQKSFSRVSEESANVPEVEALALVMGTVDFELTTQVDLSGDYLYVRAGGTISLKLNGTIETDIRETAQDIQAG